MAVRFDIGLENNDLIVEDNDLTLVESDDQHVVDLINSSPGWWKENPATGVGILDYYKAKGVEQKLARNMSIELQADGYTCNPTAQSDSSGKLTINPNVTI